MTELANELDLSKDTVRCHPATLLPNDYITRDGERDQLGFHYLDPAETVKERLEIDDVIEFEVTDLAEESNDIAQFAMEEHGRAVCLYKGMARGKRTSRQPLRSGNVRIFTASRPAKRCWPIPRGARQRNHRTARTSEIHGPDDTTREELFDELERVRDEGFTDDGEEVIEGLRCIAAPVLLGDGSVLGAVSASGPSRRLNGAAFEEEYPAMVRHSANVTESNAKFSRVVCDGRTASGGASGAKTQYRDDEQEKAPKHYNTSYVIPKHPGRSSETGIGRTARMD